MRTGTTTVRMEHTVRNTPWCVFWILDQEDDDGMIIVELIRGVIMIRRQDAHQQNTIVVLCVFYIIAQSIVGEGKNMFCFWYSDSAGRNAQTQPKKWYINGQLKKKGTIT